jgi:hypothetical protein
MGLDMYAKAKKDMANKEEKAIDIAYWRKFNALHGWMEDLYKEQGGLEEFNCIPLVLTNNDLKKLKQACSDKTLEYRAGFFWGNGEPDEDDYNDILAFISEARSYMLDGYTVYYDSWW